MMNGKKIVNMADEHKEAMRCRAFCYFENSSISVEFSDLNISQPNFITSL